MRGFPGSQGVATLLFAALLCMLQAGCATTVRHDGPTPLAQRLTQHAGDDDLLTAGLGWEGLASPTPPPFDGSAASLRRRAVWTNWRGITTISEAGLGSGRLAQGAVPGRELHALLELDRGRHRHRVMLQLPQSFDAGRPCLVVSASSGSRGIYGAIALAGGWGLPRGCAIAYTDKGAGSDWIAPGRLNGPALDGSPAGAEDEAVRYELESPMRHVAIPHAHSAMHPESAWGEYVRQAALWARAQIGALVPATREVSADRWRIIATGVSNGAGAVLQAAALDWPVNAVVAVSPNVLPHEGGRALYDYATEAALWMPCAAAAPQLAKALLGVDPAAAAARCRSLQRAGWLQTSEGGSAAEAAYARLRAAGWSVAALEAAVASTRLDLWRAVGAGYASAYLRRGPDSMPCGYAYTMGEGADPALWWSDSSGIPPGNGVLLASPPGEGEDPDFPGLQCLRSLWTGDSADARALRLAVEETRAGRLAEGRPLWLLHGAEDGLVPAAFSAEAYRDANAGSPALRFRLLPRAQHFDSLLGLPAAAARYEALMPAAYAALDEAWASLAPDGD
ncbi:D-(-)-3-hydroxybutyrate oligomer hydrolase [Pseudomarimonas salicorniae]|uniref:D-(-)-3-hydroxybutyrate oligomer hydrolase n=1 Tax=Pseudomarimonas salicorniae TaxID=2933270 RepID=A0ABT0GJE3_9GAMM|nr:D-(-)-3-hydroxybutyrate oligomer hydrolase [Lysobacter sp. CAU 1642]MCK7594665.1 D-(-)-3-hydroxybutyrate oligomer hydrolase [Lysobacter sp. CAU 1642]